MLPRILIVIIVFGILYFMYLQVIALSNRNRCDYCAGNGYWKGTRGEKNHCKACNGSGKVA